MKNKVVKKLTALVMSAMVIGSIGVVTAEASNWVDSNYSYDFSTKPDRTPVREKQDASSCYMSCYYAQGTYKAQVVSVVNGLNVDCAGGNYYTFRTGTTHYLTNYVYENGYRNAAIFAIPEDAGKTATGVWSPDSI